MNKEYKTKLEQAYNHLRSRMKIFGEEAARQSNNTERGAIIFGAMVSAPIIAAGYVAEVGSILVCAGLKGLEGRAAA